MPWEWRDPYRIRNALYPIYLSWPLQVLKYLEWDYQPLVVASPYIAHFPLMVLSDWFLWRVGKATVGKEATRIAFILLLTNGFMIEYEIRCFTNTLEKICTVVAFHFYLKQKSEFNANTVIFTVLLTIGFMMRNTSPVGWVPLLFTKMVYDGAFMPFLISGVIVALPLVITIVYLDSLYYMQAYTASTGTSLDRIDGGDVQKKFEWTVTGYNFLRINVLEGLSKFFGDHQMTEYIFNFLPNDIFRGLFPSMLLGHYKYFREKNSPDLVYICAFYVLFFSLIGHKENRFLLPILPFMFLLTGYQIKDFTMRFPNVVRILLWGIIIYEAFFFSLRANFHHQFWDVLEYVNTQGDEPPHSMYTMHRFEAPYYSWLHQRGQHLPEGPNRTKLYVVQQGPNFARKAFGAPLQLQNPDYTSYYLESIDRLVMEQMLPQWYVLPERSKCCAHRYYCFQAAQHAIEHMGNETKMYELEKVFYSEVLEHSPRKAGSDWHFARRFLYKLDYEKYTPF
jgi:GPI mannosyltransferase 3